MFGQYRNVRFLGGLAVLAITFSGTAQAGCKEGATQTTASGARFVCVGDSGPLGESWQDPAGLIWGDEASSWGRPAGFYESEAERYCADRSARLPTSDELCRLASYMGTDCRNGYGNFKAEVLPNFGERWLWSSTVASEHYKWFYAMDTKAGYTEKIASPGQFRLGARCVRESAR